jgi:hypothetical protein
MIRRRQRRIWHNSSRGMRVDDQMEKKEVEVEWSRTDQMGKEWQAGGEGEATEEEEEEEEVEEEHRRTYVTAVDRRGIGNGFALVCSVTSVGEEDICHMNVKKEIKDRT